MTKKGHIIVLLLSIFSLVVSFIFDLDTSIGPQDDFNSTWKFIHDLNSDLSILYTKKMGTDYLLLHYPLHYLIVSRFNFFIEITKIF